MVKFGKLLLGSIMVISLIGCNSQPKINSKEKELLTTIEIAASKQLKKFLRQKIDQKIIH